MKLSDVLNLRNSETIWGIKLIFCFHWSYILVYDSKTLLANQFAGFFIFNLFDLLILIIPGVQCYIVLASDRCFLKSLYVFVIIVLFMKSHYDGNIYSYKYSHLETQKECILFGKSECFSKWVTFHESGWFCCWILWINYFVSQ